MGDRSSFRFRASGLPAALAALALAACVNVDPPLRDPAPYLAEGYTRSAPVEVAVLLPPKVPNLDRDGARLVQETAYRELLGKGYTPLAPAYVESRSSEVVPFERPRGRPLDTATLRGALPADAYLEIELRRVVPLPFVDPPVMEIEGRASLLDASAGEVLFGQDLRASYELPASADDSVDPAVVREQLVRHVKRLLLALPARRP